jgi:hypothetical protein
MSAKAQNQTQASTQAVVVQPMAGIVPCADCGLPAVVNAPAGPGNDSALDLCATHLQERWPGGAPRAARHARAGNCGCGRGTKEFLLEADRSGSGACGLCVMEAMRRHDVGCSMCGAKLTSAVWISPAGKARVYLCNDCAKSEGALAVGFLRVLDAAREVADARTRAEHEAAEVRRTLPGRLAIAARDAPTQEEAEAHVRRLLAGHVAGL